MYEEKGQQNSETYEVQAKLLLVGKALPGTLLKHILRTPYAPCRASVSNPTEKSYFTRCAVSQAHHYAYITATQYSDQSLLHSLACWDRMQSKNHTQ